MCMLKDKIRTVIEKMGGKAEHRTNCPSCGGINTFSVSDRGTVYLYNCYRNSCSLRSGRINKSVSDIVAYRAKVIQPQVESFRLPDYFMPINSRCLEMINEFHGQKALDEGLYQCCYDPRLDRLVYLVKNEFGEVVSATGRRMSGNGPKNHNYGDMKRPFIVGTLPTGVVVEGPLDAAAVARNDKATGIALCGTHLKQDYIKYLLDFERLFIAVDRDAVGKKSLYLKKTLDKYVPTSVLLLGKDIKNQSDSEWEELWQDHMV